jgi:hypothetical protein
MNHSARAGLLALAGSILATIAYVEAQPLLTWLGQGGLPAWLVQLRIFLIPLITMAAAWAGHYLLTRDPNPPLPPGVQEPGVANAPKLPPPPAA